MANPRKTLTDADIARLETGAGAVEASTEQTEAEAAAAQAAATQAAADAAAAEAQAAADIAAREQAEREQAERDAAAAAQGEHSEVVAFLQGQIKEKDDQLVDARVQIKALETKVTGMEASHGGLLDIARNSVAKMQIALGGSAVDLSAADAATVLAQHAAVKKTFEDKFKVGGVAAVAATEEEQNEVTETALDGERKARIEAARIGGK